MRRWASKVVSVMAGSGRKKKAGEGGLSDDDAPGFAVCFAMEQGNDFG